MDFINRKQTADYLQVTLLTVINYEKIGLLKPVQLYNMVVYDSHKVLSLCISRAMKVEQELKTLNEKIESLKKSLYPDE